MFLNFARHSRLQGSVESGAAGGFFDVRLGRDNVSSHEQGDAPNAADKNNQLNYIEAAQLYGWYTFGNCKIMAGKMDGSILAMTPAQNLGFNTNNHIAGFGWGAIYDDRAAQLRFVQNISKAFGWQISLVQPNVYEYGVGIGSNDSYAQIPAVHVKFNLNFGPVSLFPGGFYGTVKWDNVPNDWDNSLQYWYVQLPVRVMAGPFTGLFQLGYGQNLAGGTSSPLSLQSGYWSPIRGADGKVQNATGWAGFFDLSFNAGAVIPHLYFGYDNPKNSDAWKVGDDYNARMMYGASVLIPLHENFALSPEVTYYDYGKVPGNAAKPDIGKEWLAGVQFRFVF